LSQTQQKQPPTQSQKFRIILLNAMTRPLSAAVVAITLIVGLLVNPWFFAVGGAFYAFLVWSTLQDAGDSKQVLNEVLYPERTRKLDLNKLQGGYRDALTNALNTRKKIETAVAETDDPGIRKALTDSTDNLDELTGTIYDLALKAQNVETSLQGTFRECSGLRITPGKRWYRSLGVGTCGPWSPNERVAIYISSSSSSFGLRTVPMRSIKTKSKIAIISAGKIMNGSWFSVRFIPSSSIWCTRGINVSGNKAG
jgi:hypothetical protein